MRRLSVLVACLVVALTLIAIAVVPGASAAPKQQQPVEDYLVTWSDPQLNAYPGYSSGIVPASRQAQLKCETEAGAGNCTADVWVRNGYIAYVLNFDESTVWYHWGHTRGEAVQRALTGCQNASTGCTVSQTFKSRAYNPALSTEGGFDVPIPQ
jgi:hypothetical protein